MSALEDILGTVVDKAVGDEDKAKLVETLLPLVVSLLASGGLEEILGKMKDQGLSSQADSWVGGGENKSISGDQAKKVVGDDEVKRIAGQIGLPEDQTADLIAKALPLAVDQASPDGDLPDAAAVDEALTGEGKLRRGIDR